jgi:hypothetical protein
LPSPTPSLSERYLSASVTSIEGVVTKTEDGLGVSTEDHFTYNITGFAANETAFLSFVINTSGSERPTVDFSNDVEILRQNNFYRDNEGERYKTIYFKPASSDISLTVSYSSSSTISYGGSITAYQAVLSD